MSKSRVPLLLGAAAAGGVGYYLYNAGGDTKVAQKQAEADYHAAAAKVKSELPGKGKEYEKNVEKYGAEAGAKFDSAVNKTKADLEKGKADAEAWAKDTKAAVGKKVDEFDKSVEAKAAEAKNSVKSWWGGK